MGNESQSEAYDHVADLYDHVPSYRDRDDIPFFVRMACESGGSVLELGCGTGRILIPTARAGVAILGLDICSSMLSMCRRKLACQPSAVRSRVELVEGDVCRFALGRKFTLATAPFRLFHHLLTVRDQLACLACIRKHLAKDGRLVLDLFNPSLPLLLDQSRFSEWRDERPFTLPDGRKVIRGHRTISVDLFEQVFDCEVIYYITHPNGHRERRVHRLPTRYLFRYEAEHLLARSGFQLEHVLASYDGRLYGSVCPGELILVASPC